MSLREPIAFATQHALTIDRLAEDGWEVEERLRAVEVRSPDSSAAELLDALGPLLEATIEATIVSTTGFRLSATTGSFVVTETPHNAGDHYTGRELDAAHRATEGDIAALREVGGVWHGEARVDLARHLNDGTEGAAWRVVRHTDALVHAIQELPWWRLRELYMPTPVVCIVLSPNPIRFVAPGISVVNATTASHGLEVPVVGAKRSSVTTASGNTPPSGVPLPEELLPVGNVTNGEQVLSATSPRVAASAWAWLATDVEHNGHARLSFFGLRRVTCDIGPAGIPDPSQAEDALALYRWATSEESPDRLVAIRQVISVYGSDEFLRTPLDVRRAAEPIYRGLRTTTIGEVVASQREARRFATDAAREAASAALAAARSVGERTLAALAALGALVVANATTAQVSIQVVRQLAFGIAAFTLALALWSLIVEGPSISVPLRALREDLDVVGDLLGEDARNEVIELQVVNRARQRALVVRVATPLAYVAVTAVALWLAYPHPTWLWP